MNAIPKMAAYIALLTALFFAEKTVAIAQQDPPSKVENAFKEQFPSIQDVRWAKNDNNYIAEFKDHNIPVKVLFDSSGNFVESEKEIEVSALPEKVVQYITTQDETAKIYKAYRIEKNGQRKELYDVVAKIHYKKSRITISRDGYLTSH